MEWIQRKAYEHVLARCIVTWVSPWRYIIGSMSSGIRRMMYVVGVLESISVDSMLPVPSTHLQDLGAAVMLRRAVGFHPGI